MLFTFVFTSQVPQQPYLSKECGLFVLEFIERYFVKSPFLHLSLPINASGWFDSYEVYRHKRVEIANVMKIIRMSETNLPNDLVDLFDGQELTSVFLSSKVSTEPRHNDVSAVEESMDHCDADASTSEVVDSLVAAVFIHHEQKRKEMGQSKKRNRGNRAKLFYCRAKPLKGGYPCCFVCPSEKKLTQHMKWHQAVTKGKKKAKKVTLCVLRCSANIPSHLQKGHYKIAHGLKSTKDAKRLRHIQCSFSHDR